MATMTSKLKSGRIEKKKRARKIALLGYCVESMEAAQQLGYDFVAVVPPGFAEQLDQDGISAVTWDYELINENSYELAQTMQSLGVTLAVPLFEETVEWAGALNARFLDNPRLFNRSLLFRDKAMMKRKAQMSGIRVGVFEEVDSIETAKRFWERVNEALVPEDASDYAPVHLKPKSAAGCVGHYMIKNPDDLLEIPLEAFPCLAESHLHGQEFSCEVFVHNGQIRFMNINEYIHLGYSQLLPPTPTLEKHRPKIHRAIEQLIKAFEVRNGVIHPEYFLDADEELNFGEVASRIPGGHIFELIERAYGFDAFAGQILCSDPDTSEEELSNFFPHEIEGRLGHAGNLLVYPKKKVVKQLAVPAALEAEEYYLKHNLFEPINSKVAERVGFGNHYGKVDFFGDDPVRLKTVIEHYETQDFYE